MKVLLFLLLSTACFAQIKEGDVIDDGDIVEVKGREWTNPNGSTLVEVKQAWPNTKRIQVVDGGTYKWRSNSSKPDTAMFFETGLDEYEFTTIARRIVPPVVEMKIEAETARVIDRAQLDAATQNKTVCCVTATPLTNTKLIFDGEKNTGERKKVVFNYCRGNAGLGKIVVSFTKGTNTVSHTFYLLQTDLGLWKTWKELEFDIPPNQVGVMTISTDQFGAWNLDYVVFK